MEGPRVIAGRSHGREPNLPVDARLIGRDKRRTPIGITRLRYEFVLFPFSVAGNDRIISSFKNNFVALTADCSERAVSVDQIESVERRIHHLATRDQVE